MVKEITFTIFSYMGLKDDFFTQSRSIGYSEMFVKVIAKREREQNESHVVFFILCPEFVRHKLENKMLNLQPRIPITYASLHF